MVDQETLAIGGISSISLIAVHEYLHKNDSLAADIPNLTGTELGANVGSVSIGIAAFALVGVLINYYYWEEISE